MNPVKSVTTLAVLLLGIRAALGATPPGASYSFSLARIEAEKVVFKGGTGTLWTEVSYGCAGCHFLVSREGVRGAAPATPESRSMPGLEVQLIEHGSALRFTCQAVACEFQVIQSPGHPEMRTLNRGETTSVPSKREVSIKVSE